MKNCIKISLIFLFLTAGFAQKNKADVECGYFGKKTTAQRNKMFPFSEAKKVLLIAFPNVVIADDEGTRTIKDSIEFASIGYKIEKTFVFSGADSEKSKETYFATKIVELETDAINDLSNLLFNYQIKINKGSLSLEVIGCYTPRNAVLFLDDADTVISVLELCFECRQYYLIPDLFDTQMTLFSSCDTKVKYFEELFLRNGFKIESSNED